MAGTPIKDTLHTHTTDGTVVDIYPKTSEDQVDGLEDYFKNATCDDHTISMVKASGSKITLEVSNEIISTEEIRSLWNTVDSSERYY